MDRAVNVLKHGLDIHPTFSGGFELLARVLAEEGRHAESLECWERCLALEPDNAEALRGAAAARSRLSAAAPPRLAHPATARGVQPRVAESGEPATPVVPSPPPSPAVRVRGDAPLASGPAATPSPRPITPSPARTDAATLAVTDVLLGLIEYRDPRVRAVSSVTRLLAGAIGRNLGVEPAALRDVELAALLRNVGALPLGQATQSVDQTRDGADRHADAALELFAGAGLAQTVRDTIRHQQERWDGGGRPGALSANAIPFGARIVAVADAFAASVAAGADTDAALAAVRAGAGTRFDPAVADALHRVVTTTDWRGVGFGLREPLLLVDGDEARAVVLAVRLCTLGYLAECASSTDAALERLGGDGHVALLVSATLPRAELATLLEQVRQSHRHGLLPVLATDATPADRIALIELGADVCLPAGCGFEEVRVMLEVGLRRQRRLRAGGSQATATLAAPAPTP